MPESLAARGLPPTAPAIVSRVPVPLYAAGAGRQIGRAVAELVSEAGSSGGAEAPRGAAPDMFKVVGGSAAGGTRVFEVEGRENSVGGKAVTVPATCAGFIKAHETYGSLPLKDVVAPAAKLAKEGFTLGWDQSLILGALAREARRCPAIDDAWSPGGFPASPGTKIAQPDLAKLLVRIGEQGRSAVYEGKVARRVEEAVASAGGVLDAEDLAAYEPTLGKPISIRYRDYLVSTTNTPSGGVTMLEALKVLERFDLSSMGHNSGEYLHVLVEASRHAFADRYSLLGDWEHAEVPLEGLLSDSYADELSGPAPQVLRQQRRGAMDQVPWRPNPLAQRGRFCTRGDHPPQRRGRRGQRSRLHPHARFPGRPGAPGDRPPPICRHGLVRAEAGLP